MPQKNLISKRFKKIKQAYLSDQFHLRKSLKRIESLNQEDVKNNKNPEKKLLEWDQQLQQSIDKVQQRKKNLPAVLYPDELPVSHKIDEILTLFKKHQLIIIAGHTGSGKTTQLPKMCLQAGRGIYGKIAHTQPRRIAASSVANRIAQELDSQPGEHVGYKIRFHDHTSDSSYIKLMTDGILLAEIKTDRFLQQYDTIIIDEAHERSLNIDFLLGYIKKLLPKRPDLKVIITSATINTKRFSEFFNKAPIIEVSGQTYPVEVRYRPPISLIEGDQNNDAEELSIDINQAIVNAVNELIGTDSSGKINPNAQAGDILVFLSGEKEIRDARKELLQQHYQDIEIIPLYARLSQAEQSRIFKPHNNRRIILATNIAETSLTIPGIRFVIDTGLAKISRYSVHSKIQRLPIERISRASAQQRSGRCGRMSAGIAIRLYDEMDFNLRAEFTEAEILRTNLAQVILQMLVLKLGKIELFPFIDAPAQRQINDGLLLLKQLDAIKSHSSGKLSLTAIGHKLARLSIEPRLARVIVEAESKKVLPEILLICSALSCQDVRERPSNARQQADEKHRLYNDKRSDFITFLNLWCDIKKHQGDLSQNKFRKYCKENFLSYIRIREWQDIHRQLRTQLHELGIKDKTLNCDAILNDEKLDYDAIHRSLLSGLSGFVATLDEDRKYLACRSLSVLIHPGSTLYKKAPKWIIAAEVVETQKVYARITAVIDPTWIEEQAGNLIKHHYYDPHWNNNKGRVFAKDKMSLYGLVINPGKIVPYGLIDPQLSHEIFIKEALVSGSYTGFHRKQPDFIKHNIELIENIVKLEHKSRRQDILVDDLEIFEFYKSRITQQIYDRIEFEKWSKQAFKRNNQLLFMTEDDLKQHNAEHITDELYPPEMSVNGISIPLEYHFMPSHPLDGVTAIFPLKIINQLETHHFEWLVPGLIREKITIIFRSLPKLLRRHLVPIPDKITLFLEQQANTDSPRDNSLNQAVLSFLTQQLREYFGQRLDEMVNQEFLLGINMPHHLQMNFRIMDENNQELDSSRDLVSLKQKWGKKASQQIDQGYSHNIERTGILSWDFDSLDKQLEVKQAGIKMKLYPALTDEKESVAITLYDTPIKANYAMAHGLFRLYYLQLHEVLRSMLKQSDFKKKLQKLCLSYASMGSSSKLHEEIIAALVKESCHPQQLIYSKDEFSKQLLKAKESLSSILNEQINYSQQALDAWLSINKLFKKNIPFNQIQTYQQIKQQLSQLFYPGFISQTPLYWLRRIPRYIKAIEIRLIKSANDPRKDQLLHSEVEALYSAMADRFPQIISSESKPIDSITLDSELVHFRWLIEEFRISLFAQELKTVQPVSVKRLEKLWNAIK